MRSMLVRVSRVEELRSKGYEPYAYKWDRSNTAKELQDAYDHLASGEECKEVSVSISGRVIARRAFGKLAFLTLRDDSGTIQLYCEKESLTDDLFEQLKTFVDIGDILGASGSIKKTEKGELSVYVKYFKILTKSLLPLPDKYHGLNDVDKRYRQRYVDMIANPEVADVFRIRAKIVSEIRKTMESLGFIEVETPVLQVYHMEQLVVQKRGLSSRTTYRRAAEHRAYLEEEHRAPPGAWQWIERRNPAAAFPTDFGVLEIRDAGRRAVIGEIEGLALVKDVQELRAEVEELRADVERLRAEVEVEGKELWAEVKGIRRLSLGSKT
uniref:lysine--tRNA ligase n=1 Tax=Ananas comosus var. bracteatus TaxID=296719 RepID=A0A6V7Q0B7_ANACO|nr:unnamed protein product [Ananas comosus var. bracteatus]